MQNPTAEGKEPDRVRGMFDRLAGRYDLLNHLLSANLDRRWRRKAVRRLPESDEAAVLDLCGGTGDLSVELVRSGRAGSVVCCDFSHRMLTVADRKFDRRRLADRCFLVEADGLRLPFPDETFTAVTVAFGVRNLTDMDRGFREMQRVLRPGGMLIVLEFSTPTAPVLAPLYRTYLRRLLPRIGDSVSGNRGPYGYLGKTIAEFPEPAELAGRIRDAGFAACGWEGLTGGIVAVHTAYKGPAGAGGLESLSGRGAA